MSTGYLRSISAGCFVLLLMLAFTVSAQVAVEQPQPSAPVVAEAETAVSMPLSDAAVSEADENFRRGVSLYRRDLYREALTEFNRALANDPNHAQAREFQEKCNTKLRISLGETVPESQAAFEIIDPETLNPGTESPQLSADEIKRERVNELLRDGKRYLEHQKFVTAVEIYNQVLLIDPRNDAAKEGLHEATLGKHNQSIQESRVQVEKDTKMIFDHIEQAKRLPEGAGADGIKDFRFTVPDFEEEYIAPKEKSPIEMTLESPVSIEFEDIHISDIVEFIADSYDINIVIDTRAVNPPQEAQSPANQAGAGAGARAGGRPGAPAAYGGRASAGGRNAAAGNRFGNQATRNRAGGAGGVGNAAAGLSSDSFYGGKSSGVVPYINLKDVTLEEALKALLRPLGLDYSVQPGFIWISKPDIIRWETFEEIETRYYELRNAGSETLFKLVLRNVFGGVSSSGGYGNSGGGNRSGGSSYGGSNNRSGGSSYGGGGGSSYGGGNRSGGSSSYGGGGGSSYGGSNNRSGGSSYGGSNNRSGGGSYGGGRGGNSGGSDVTSLSNISDMFSSISDATVGEPPSMIEAAGLNTVGTGAGNRNSNRQTTGGGYQGAQGQAQLGGSGSNSVGLGSDIVATLERLIPQVREPYSDNLLSDMLYNPANNLLIVKNTPTNLEDFEKQLAQFDTTPKQVSIEAKFLTIRLEDLKKIGFKWDAEMSDQNNRSREIASLAEETYSYDVNGDGVDEEVPFYVRPDGSNVVRNTITDGTLAALASPALSAAADSTLNIAGTILQNADGDSLSVTFDYIDSLDESELLSAPRVTTMNRKPAVVADFITEYFIGESYNEVYTSDAGFGGTPTTSVIQNVTPISFNFGIALSVTPQIRDNDQVRLWLNPEVRTRTGEKTFTQTSIVQDSELESEIILPTTSWQAVWTNVIVHDGDTLVLGGLVQDQTIKGEQKMPYIADIPVIGFFFRGKSREVSQSSLLIFVTPDIIDTTGARFFDVGADMVGGA